MKMNGNDRAKEITGGCCGAPQMCSTSNRARGLCDDFGSGENDVGARQSGISMVETALVPCRHDVVASHLRYGLECHVICRSQTCIRY